MTLQEAEDQLNSLTVHPNAESWWVSITAREREGWLEYARTTRTQMPEDAWETSKHIAEEVLRSVRNDVRRGEQRTRRDALENLPTLDIEQMPRNVLALAAACLLFRVSYAELRDLRVRMFPFAAKAGLLPSEYITAVDWLKEYSAAHSRAIRAWTAARKPGSDSLEGMP